MEAEADKKSILKDPHIAKQQSLPHDYHDDRQVHGIPHIAI
jgi:hypothetical protein